MLIDALRGRREIRIQLADLVEGGHKLSTAAINIAEVCAGMRPAEQTRTEEFLANLECHPMTATIARRAGSLKSTLSAKGKIIALADMTVAATALEHELTSMTENRKDFPVAELKFYPATTNLSSKL